MEKELLSNVLQIQAQLRILHWQTEHFLPTETDWH